MRFNANLGIQIVEPGASRFELRGSDIGSAVENLPVQIRRVDLVEIDEADPAHPCRGEIDSDGTSQSSCPNDQDGGALELLLTFFADLRKDQMTCVPRAFALGEHRCLGQ